MVLAMPNMLDIQWPDGQSAALSTLWLRDNCPCPDCRVTQTQEKRFHIASVPIDYAPDQAQVEIDQLVIRWPEGHESRYSREFLMGCGQSIKQDWQPWQKEFLPQYVDYAGFLSDDQTAIEAIQAFLKDGVVIIDQAPREVNTLEALAPRLGPVRELLFERIHNVQVDPSGYNVAHTNLPLPPHNDFASYSWPPSIQALHMLVNEAEGGRSTLLDGWGALEAFRAQYPDEFETLCKVPVPFREFDDNNETFATAPMIQLDSKGNIALFRYSNQLMQPLDPSSTDTADFYNAYHLLSQQLFNSPFECRFRLEGGQIIVAASHRVLHGREAIETAGKRHLQDAYFEHDNVRNLLTVLKRKNG